MPAAKLADNRAPLDPTIPTDSMIDPRTYRPSADILKDRVILVTGASDGIGKAVAEAAAAHGARVILHGRNVRRLEALYDAILAAGHPRPSILPLDFGVQCVSSDGSDGHVDLRFHGCAWQQW